MKTFPYQFVASFDANELLKFFGLNTSTPTKEQVDDFNSIVNEAADNFKRAGNNHFIISSRKSKMSQQSQDYNITSLKEHFFKNESLITHQDYQQHLKKLPGFDDNNFGHQRLIDFLDNCFPQDLCNLAAFVQFIIQTKFSIVLLLVWGLLLGQANPKRVEKQYSNQCGSIFSFFGLLSVTAQLCYQKNYNQDLIFEVKNRTFMFTEDAFKCQYDFCSKQAGHIRKKNQIHFETHTCLNLRNNCCEAITWIDHSSFKDFFSEDQFYSSFKIGANKLKLNCQKSDPGPILYTDYLTTILSLLGGILLLAGLVLIVSTLLVDQGVSSTWLLNGVTAISDPLQGYIGNYIIGTLSTLWGLALLGIYHLCIKAPTAIAANSYCLMPWARTATETPDSHRHSDHLELRESLGLVPVTVPRSVPAKSPHSFAIDPSAQPSRWQPTPPE